jgi:hypothetical protein
VKASLLMALVVIFARLSLENQLRLAREDPGSEPSSELMAEIRTDGTSTQTRLQIAAYCPIALNDQSLSQGCPVTVVSCQDDLVTKYPASVVESRTIDDGESLVTPPSRRTRTNCIESVATNSSTIDLRPSRSVCS